MNLASTRRACESTRVVGQSENQPLPVMRIAAGADSLELGVHENQVVFVADGVTLTPRRIGQRVRVRLLRRWGKADHRAGQS